MKSGSGATTVHQHYALYKLLTDLETTICHYTVATLSIHISILKIFLCHGLLMLKMNVLIQ